ncbi:MAG: hypothetical protein MR487_12225 [Lachnospiraceae bacterium]|nr:hypothetical protein [Lachnospiraceae bacterium]
MMPTITDWLMVVITAVYVIATIAICWANINSAKATREQLAESKRQFDENNRAFVTVTFEIIRSGLAVLNIQNLGHRIAQNVKIQIDKDFLDNIPDTRDKEHLEKLCASSFTLGIEKSWYICLGSHLDLDKLGERILRIDICYKDAQSEYKESTTIDLTQYFWSLIYNSPTEDLYQETKRISKAIQSIDKSIQKLQQKKDTFEQIEESNRE